MDGQDQDEIWVTQDGRRILVGDLTEEHAKAILRMILRARRQRREARRLLALRAQKHGADDMFDEDAKWGHS